MEFSVTDRAAQWYKDEVGIPEGFGIRYKTKIYSGSPINQSFGLAIESEKPSNPIAVYTADNGLTFFIEENDAWFFNGYGLRVDFNESLGEPKYVYLKDGKEIE